MKKWAMAAAAVWLVSGCATQQQVSAASGFDGDLRVVEIAGQSPLSDRGQVTFDRKNGRVAAYFGCNRMIGSYVLRGSELTFSPMASTRMACPGRDDDAKASAALERVRSWRSETGGNRSYLNLLDDKGTTVMKLQASPLETVVP